MKAKSISEEVPTSELNKRTLRIVVFKERSRPFARPLNVEEFA